MRLAPVEAWMQKQIAAWRVEARETLRTPGLWPLERQEAWFRNVVCNPESRHRYFALVAEEHGDSLVGVGGLVNIEWENRRAEISLLLDPQWRRQGLGWRGALLLYDEAFEMMGLNSVWGECYLSNEAGVKLWSGIVEQYGGQAVTMLNTQWRRGKWWGSMLFAVTQREYMNKRAKEHV